MKKSHALICIAAVALAFGSLTLLALNMAAIVEQPPFVKPPIVNGSDSQRVDIVVGHDTIIILDTPDIMYRDYDSGFGDIYWIGFSDYGYSRKNVLYEDMYWTLIYSDAGWLVYVTGGS